MILQGLSYLALAARSAGISGWNWRAGKCKALFFGFSGLAAITVDAQQQPATDSPWGLSIYAERLKPVEPPRPDAPFLSYEVHDELMDNFDHRSLQFYFLHEYLRDDDENVMRDRFGGSARRRIERSFTRTLARAFEQTAFVQNLKEEPWAERLFIFTKDAFLEDAPTIGSPFGENDPHVDYEVEKMIVKKPEWKERVNFFFRPFSLNPNVGVGLKIDGMRAEMKAYYDEVKVSTFMPITDNWNLYSSARMKKFSVQDTSFTVGFQHTLNFFPWIATDSGVLQYGVTIKQDSWTTDSGEARRQFRPHAFLAFVFEF